MTIPTVSKNQPMREGEIAAIDVLNECVSKINKTPTLLYNSSIDGTFSKADTKTIQNLSDFCLFAVKPDVGDIFCLVFCPPDWTAFRGIGGTISATPNIFAYVVHATKNGNELTLNTFGSINVSGTSITQYNIERIYGII